MDWIRENKKLAAILGLMVFGGIGLAVMLFMAYSAYAASLERHQAVNASLASIKGAKLFPSPENVQAKETAIGQYEDAVDSLGSVLIRLQQPVKPMTDTDFQARLKARIAEVKQMAEGRTTLPKEFAFGFDTYTGSLPRSAEAAAELGDYLAAVDEMVKMFIDAGIASITALERSELSVEKGAPPPPPPPPPKKDAKVKTTTKTKSGKQAAPPKEIAKVVERRTVKCSVVADQGPLQVLMNKLASPSQMPFFTVVRLLRVENEKLEGPLRSAVQAPRDDETEPKPPTEPPNPNIIEPAKPAREDSVAVLGQENLKVYLEIDLVRFLEPPPETPAK